MPKEIVQRANYIDAVKGLAILCITFLHFEQGVIPQWLNVWIGMFMISTFYFTSGWITSLQSKSITPKDLFKKRIKQLGIPYLWFSALIIAFDIIWCLFGFMETQILLRDIYKTITLRGIGTLWFLPVLFIGEFIFCTIKNSKHKLILATVGIIIVLTTQYLYYEIWGAIKNESTFNRLIDAPLQPIAQGVMSWPIIAIGFLFAKYIWKEVYKLKKTFILLIGVAIISFSILLIVAPPFKLYYINGVLSNFLPAVGFICLFVALGEKNHISRFFTFWGINSLILMCTHYSITMEIFKTLNAKFIHTGFTGYTTIIYFIITILVTYPLVWLFNHKLKFMIGKK